MVSTFPVAQKKPVPIDNMVPGYSSLDTNDRADASVTALIKELKKAKIDPVLIFNASSGNSDGARNLKIKDSFKKFLPNLNPGLVDAACNSFGADGQMVTKAAFLNTFNEVIDSRMNSNSTPVKTHARQPSSESAGVPVQGQEADSLLKKLDTAMRN